MRRVWIALGLCIAVLAALAAGLSWWIHAYLRSEEFRRLVAAKTGEALRMDADYQPLSWSGASAFSAGLAGQGEPGATVEKLTAEQLRANVDWRAIFDGVWRVERVDVVRLDVALRPESARAASATQPGPERDAAPPKKGWLPNRFQLDQLSAQDANLALGLAGRLRNVALTARPEGGGWVVDGRGGKLEVPPRELGVDSFRARWQQGVVYLTDASLRLGKSGTISVSGEIGGSKGPYALHLEWENVDVGNVLDATWKSRLAGTLSGEADCLGRGNHNPLTTGRFRLVDGLLTGLPVQRQIAKFTQLPSFERMPLREISGDFETDGVTTTVKNFVLESPGLLRVEGRVRLGAAGKLDGHFRIGVTSQSLQWLPGSQEKVFLVSENGYRWTNLKVGGTVDRPTEDLSARLTRAVGEKAVDTGLDLIRQAPTRATDAVDDAIKIFSPLIP